MLTFLLLYTTDSISVSHPTLMSEVCVNMCRFLHTDLIMDRTASGSYTLQINLGFSDWEKSLRVTKRDHRTGKRWLPSLGSAKNKMFLYQRIETSSSLTF